MRKSPVHCREKQTDLAALRGTAGSLASTWYLRLARIVRVAAAALVNVGWTLHAVICEWHCTTRVSRENSIRGLGMPAGEFIA